MPRRLLALVLIALAALPALAKENEKDSRVRTEIETVMLNYLDARFRGAPWKEFSDVVLWTADQEPSCSTVIRSYDLGPLRIPEKDRALASVTFYELGTYCPAEKTFTPAPRLDTAIYQLRKRSILWLVEKTNRPGGQLDWKVLRDRLKQQLGDPNISTADTAKLSNALTTLEKTANAIGRTASSDKR
jgi:hypothetical protein